METTLGYLLLAGVVLATLLVVAGLVWSWAKTSRLGVEYAMPKVTLFRFAATEASHALSGDIHPRLLISLGITVLLVTPYLRVVSSLLFFALRERDLKYSLFTGFVLVVLTYSLWLR